MHRNIKAYRGTAAHIHNLSTGWSWEISLTLHMFHLLGNVSSSDCTVRSWSEIGLENKDYCCCWGIWTIVIQPTYSHFIDIYPSSYTVTSSTSIPAHIQSLYRHLSQLIYSHFIDIYPSSYTVTELKCNRRKQCSIWNTGDISGFHSSKYEDDSLLGYSAMQSRWKYSLLP
jgi:hypothetical protein